MAMTEDADSAYPEQAATGTGDTAQSRAIELLAEVLYLPHDSIDPDASWEDLGLDSVLAVEYVTALSAELGRSVKVDDLYEQETPRALARHLAPGREPG